MPFIPKPAFPNVPKLPGIPQVARSPNFPVNLGPALTAAAALGALWRAVLGRPTWGVFKQPPPIVPDESGIETVTVTAQLVPVVTVDSVLDFDFRSDFDIPDYPVQDGSFTNVNKVNLPNELSVRLIRNGSERDRSTFLDQVDAICKSLELFQIITPERTYLNVNPYRFEVSRRGGSGAYSITEADLYFREIRTVTAQYTNTSTTTQNAQNPSAQSVQNRGTLSGEVPATPPVLDGVVSQ